MDEAQTMRQLWDYYKTAAEIRGRGAEVPSEDGGVHRKQLSFSLLWFYQRDPEGLNLLTRAFLGDRQALEAMKAEETPPEGWETFLLEGMTPNDSQRDAIRSALTAPLSFIQGPPGTGKTATILNLACCAARSREGCSVAVVSSNNSALVNLWEKIRDFEDDAPNKRWMKEHFARLGGIKIRKKFQDHRPEAAPPFRFSSQRISIAADDGELTVSREKRILADEFLSAYPIITSTIHSLKNCFADGSDYLYDYVIMDESSQTDTVAGLVAMSAAKHLVLVGDPKQLPPVISSFFVQEMEEAADRQGLLIPGEYAAAPDRSFLDACLDVFRDRTVQTTLRVHYRCHPGIIGFCIKEVYQEERLEVKTPRWDTSVRTPIRVLWFEGNYCEGCRLTPSARKEKDQKKKRRSKRNRKQILCFMEEEWPRLWEMFLEAEKRQEKPPSVCILSPFLGQLEALDKALREFLIAQGRDAKDLCLSLEEDKEPDGSALSPVRLTIHKSQGREFDIVYLLPVEDGDWEWPWSQQKRLINVAVSRAMKELRLVLSSVLMEEDMQAELTGRPVQPGRRNKDPEKNQHLLPKDQRFLQKLVRYVQRENLALEQETALTGYPASAYEYGFHRSVRTSIFDREPWLRAVLSKMANAQNQEGTPLFGSAEPWTPELCAETALIQMMRKIQKEQGISLTLFKNVFLRDIRDSSGRLLSLPEADKPAEKLFFRGGHLDFVLCLKGRILLAVEVDGRYHRAPNQEGGRQKERDDAKDRLLRNMGVDCFKGNARMEEPFQAEGRFAFLRLPDDGTTCLETEELWENAPEYWKNRYFPIEELLEAYLKKLETGPAYYIAAKPISLVIHDWIKPELEEGENVPARAAALKLRDKGVLENRLCPVLEEKARLSLAPTRRGEKMGISEVIQCGQNWSGEYDIYCNALYPPYAQRKVLEVLNGYPLLEADMPVGKLLSLIFRHFRLYVNRQETPEERIRFLNQLSQSIFFLQDKADYSSEAAQAMYLLRYFYSCAYEYKQMYLSMLDREVPDGKRLTVTSIGCGSLVDYWSLRAAIAERPDSVSNVDYTGVDINAWSRKFRIRAADGDRVEFIQKDAAAYLREQAASGALASDVYLFPKSIGEFDGRECVGGPLLEAVRNGLQDVLRSSPKNRVWLLFSLSKSGSFGESDRRKCSYLRQGLTGIGFHTADADGLFVTAEERQLISHMDSSFYYPYHIRAYLEGLEEYEGKRSPVQCTGHECYQALLFEREESAP